MVLLLNRQAEVLRVKPDFWVLDETGFQLNEAPVELFH
jgi:hypothetical protein